MGSLLEMMGKSFSFVLSPANYIFDYLNHVSSHLFT